MLTKLREGRHMGDQNEPSVSTLNFSYDKRIYDFDNNTTDD